MARIQAPEATRGVNYDNLEDDEPYLVSLKKIERSEQLAEYGGGYRLQLDWELPDSGGETIRDWVGLRLGKQKSGGVSKLRQLLNAIQEQPADTAIEWFDDESYEWSYDGHKAANRLIAGTVVQIRGSFRTKEDGSVRFTIDKYQTPKARKTRPADRTLSEAAEATKSFKKAVTRSQDDDESEDIPF